MGYKFNFMIYTARRLTKPFVQFVSKSTTERIEKLGRKGIDAKLYKWWGEKTYYIRDRLDYHFYQKEFEDVVVKPKKETQLIEYGIKSFYNFLVLAVTGVLAIVYSYYKYKDADSVSEGFDEGRKILSSDVEEFGKKLNELEEMFLDVSECEEAQDGINRTIRIMNSTFLIIETQEVRLLEELEELAALYSTSINKDISQ